MRKTICHLIVGMIIGGILILPSLATSSFPDVDECADYAEAAEFLRDARVMVGDDKGNFNPNNAVTRAEMATIICRMLDETENLTISDKFTDVSATHWANKYITKASELGFVSGYGGGKFGPNDPVTYEQAVTMLVRAWDMEMLAAAAGGYPNGYMVTADEQGFLEGVQATVGERLNHHRLKPVGSGERLEAA